MSGPKHVAINEPTLDRWNDLTYVLRAGTAREPSYRTRGTTCRLREASVPDGLDA